MRATLRNSWAFVILCGFAAGCGDDPKPEETGNTQSDDPEDGGASDDTDESDTTGEPDTDDTTADETTTTDETTTADDTDESDTTGDATNDGDLPDPVLEELPPETPLSSLDEDQLAEVCEAYLATATSITNNLDGICPAQAVLTAQQSGATTNDELQESCVAAEAMCDAQVETSKAALSDANCAQAEECGATIEDFNACNRQVAALDQMVIVPVGELEAPACESVTTSQASTFGVSGGIQVLIWMQQASEAGGGSPTEENGPCQRIREQCPELGVVLDAFSGLQLPEL